MEFLISVLTATVNQQMFTNDLFDKFRVPIGKTKFNPAKQFEIY